MHVILAHAVTGDDAALEARNRQIEALAASGRYPSGSYLPAEGADILFLDSPQSEEEMRTGIEACDGKPALAVTSPAGKHFMAGDAELERIGIRIVVYPQDILAASVRAVRDALAGLKGGTKPPMATPAELATAIRIAEYLSQDPSPAREYPLISITLEKGDRN